MVARPENRWHYEYDELTNFHKQLDALSMVAASVRKDKAVYKGDLKKTVDFIEGADSRKRVEKALRFIAPFAISSINMESEDAVLSQVVIDQHFIYRHIDNCVAEGILSGPDAEYCTVHMKRREKLQSNGYENLDANNLSASEYRAVFVRAQNCVRDNYTRLGITEEEVVAVLDTMA